MSKYKGKSVSGDKESGKPYEEVILHLPKKTYDQMQKELKRRRLTTSEFAEYVFSRYFEEFDEKREGSSDVELPSRGHPPIKVHSDALKRMKKY